MGSTFKKSKKESLGGKNLKAIATATSTDIDDIFSSAKNKQTKNPKIEGKKKEKRAEFEDESEIKGRYTEDGLRIYKWEELVSNCGGETPLCPFDCDCCY